MAILGAFITLPLYRPAPLRTILFISVSQLYSPTIDRPYLSNKGSTMKPSLLISFVSTPSNSTSEVMTKSILFF